MSASIIPAMQRLIDVLEAENAALECAKIPEVLALLPEKQQAATQLAREVSVANDRRESLCSRPEEIEETGFSAPYRELLEQMADLGHRNGELLQRAIAAQKRVIELLTKVPSHGLPPNYGQQGGYMQTTERQALFTSKA